jgi:hypothetical protein
MSVTSHLSQNLPNSIPVAEPRGAAPAAPLRQDAHQEGRSPEQAQGKSTPNSTLHCLPTYPTYPSPPLCSQYHQLTTNSPAPNPNPILTPPLPGTQVLRLRRLRPQQSGQSLRRGRDQHRIPPPSAREHPPPDSNLAGYQQPRPTQRQRQWQR